MGSVRAPAAVATVPNLVRDPLSDAFQTVRLTGAVYLDVAARAPWVAEAPSGEVLAPYVADPRDHVMEFHCVVDGECWARVEGLPPVHLLAGDVVVFPHGDAHAIASEPGLRAKAPEDPRGLQTRSLPIRLHKGPAGPAETRLICGFLSCERMPLNPLLASLPRVLHDRGGPQRTVDGAWINQFVQSAVTESMRTQPGGQCILTKLSELMFLDVIRRYIATLPANQVGWLAALRDPAVGRAIGLIHGRPGHPWTVHDLARGVGVSRSALAERFTAVVGAPPMQYLAQWRLQVASNLLRRTELGIAGVAAAVGYESEAAFSRAFKKALGTPPSAWRRQDAAADLDPASS